MDTSSTLLNPQAPVRAIFDMVGPDARCEILAETVRVWVEQLPVSELGAQYAKVVGDLSDRQLDELGEISEDLTGESAASDHVTLQVRFTDMTLAGRRATLQAAATLLCETRLGRAGRADAWFDCVLDWLTDDRLECLIDVCERVYVQDRIGRYQHN